MPTSNPETRRRLFFDMVRLRVVEETIADLYPAQEMRCPVHLYTGQEAVAVGVSAGLRRDDYVLSNHRSHGHYLAKGGDLKAMMAEIYGRVTGCAKGNGGSMHLVDLAVGFLGSAPIIGSTIPIAVGAALSNQMRGEDRVTVAYFGDAAVEAGVFFESANYAALHKLPVVFVCENNFYSVHTPTSERQPSGRQIFRMVAGLGVESEQVDGNDVEAVHAAAQCMINAARSGAGPMFLECLTYRWREHAGPSLDYGSGYRTEAEFRVWQERCPIARYERVLSDAGLLREGEADVARRRCAEEMKGAVDFARNSPFPPLSQLSMGLFADA